MLNTDYAWSMRNMITFNDNKSKIVHYRKPSIPQTTKTFYLGDNYLLVVVKQYKYLGIIFDEFADTGNRALRGIINKCKKIIGIWFYTYTKLYNSFVCPILDYCGEVWGFKDFKQIDYV